MTNNTIIELSAGETARFEVVSNERINDRVYTNVTLEACGITECILTDCDYSTADILSTTFEKCSLTDVNFTKADICTLCATSTSFTNVIFNEATITDCEFIDCTFTNCTFKHNALERCLFKQCRFVTTDFEAGSIYLNEFNSCIFNCELNDNFKYSLFNECIFTNNTIADELLYNNLFIQDKPISASKSSSSYNIGKTAVFKKYCYKYNTGRISLNNYFYSSITATAALVNEGIITRIEHFEFMKKAIAVLKEISTLTIIQSIFMLDRIEYQRDASAYTKVREKVLELVNTLYFEYLQRIKTLPKSNLKKTYEKSYCKFVFKTEPKVEISKLLNDAANELGIKGNVSRRVRTEIGSFIEFIEIVEQAKPLIDVIISIAGLALTGITAGAAMKKNNNNDKETNCSENPIVVNTYNIVSGNNFYISDAITQNYTIAVGKAFWENKLVASNDFGGYTKDNIDSVEFNVDVPNN